MNFAIDKDTGTSFFTKKLIGDRQVLGNGNNKNGVWIRITSSRGLDAELFSMRIGIQLLKICFENLNTLATC